MKQKKTAAFSTLVAVLVIASLAVWLIFPIRSAAEWLLFSRHLKSEVLAQTATNGELKHIEWGGWGWAGQDTTVYLVFDPADSLMAAAKARQSGKFSGLPCEVYRVRRLETHWYTVQFYTGQTWGRSNGEDCY